VVYMVVLSITLAGYSCMPCCRCKMLRPSHS
jgi:hypothetical protein